MLQDLGKIGLILSGGGSRGIFTMSALKAFNSFGITPDFLSTTSSGTMNGVLYASNDMEKLEQLWVNIRNNKVYKKNIFTYLNAFNKSASLYDSSPLFNLLKGTVDLAKIKENFAGSFFINVTNLNNAAGESYDVKSLLTDEDLLKVAFASASPPIFFSSVKFKINDYVDGGLAVNYPLIQAIEFGCDTIFLIMPVNKLLDKEIKINNILDMVKSTIAIATSNDLDLQMRSIKKINKLIDRHNLDPSDDFKPIRIITIAPDKDFGIDFLDFDFKGLDRKELIKYGYDLAMRTLSKELDH